VDVLVHDIPGRLRFVVPHMKRCCLTSEKARAYAQAIPGVVEAWASSLTGSLLVTYDGDAGTRERIVQVVDRFVSGSMKFVPPHPTIRSIEAASNGPAIAAVVVNALVEALVERTIQVAVAALI
jgi:hypothetical protein